MATQWYYQALGETVGPVSVSELKQCAAKGTIVDETLVRKGKDGKWVEARRVKGLLDSNTLTPLPVSPLPKSSAEPPVVAALSLRHRLPLLFVAIAAVTCSVMIIAVVLFVWYGPAARETAQGTENQQEESLSAGGSSQEKATEPTEVTGEIFVVSNGGDVKKAAGEQVYIMPVTSEWLDRAATLSERIVRWHAAEGKIPVRAGMSLQSNPHWIASQREWLALEEDGERTVFADGRALTSLEADGDGKFKQSLPPGEYILWVGPHYMGEQSWYWCERVRVKNTSIHVILGNDAMYSEGTTHSTAFTSSPLVFKPATIETLLNAILDQR